MQTPKSKHVRKGEVAFRVLNAKLLYRKIALKTSGLKCGVGRDIMAV